MTHTFTRLTSVTLLSLAASIACHAESSTSSASSAGSTSVGSSSDSIKGSSNSSSNDKKVADGDYQVMDVAEVTDKPGMLRVRLRPAAGAATPPAAADDAAFMLDLPQKALAHRALAAGDVVSVRNRVYGIEFAYAAPTHEAFFLVLADDWHDGLAAHPVKF